MSYVTEEERQAVETAEDETLIWRAPFRWQTEDGRIRHCYESFSPEGVCELRDWTLVRKVGDHMAVVEMES